MKISYKVYHLPFTHPFTISKGTKTHQPTFIVKLQHFALSGFGEAPAIAYYNIPVEKMVEDLEAKRSFIEKFAFTDPDRFWHFLHHLFPNNPFLVCALDMAAWDIYGKIKRQPLHAWWKFNLNNTPLTDFTIGIDSIEKMALKISENAYPIYKIKVGMEGDIETVAALKKLTDATFRVDANAGWTLDEAKIKIPQLHALGVELIEQPIDKNDWEGMRQLHEMSLVPLIADEACVFEQDVEKCVGHFSGINIKLTKCSGITPALRMITQAKNLGLKIMLGCMNETFVGSAAIAQLAPQANYLDVDGPLLLSENIGKSIEYNKGEIVYPATHGLGVTEVNF